MRAPIGSSQRKTISRPPPPCYPSRVTVQHIKDDAALAELVDRLEDCNVVALDTEFMRERTYQASLCLVQLNTGAEIALIDPLATVDLATLWQILNEKTLVLHAGRQDLEVLRQAAGRLPSSLIDTQIAAGLCGLAPQCGYAALVSEYCDVTLAKAHTRADWSKRPLTPGALDYASDDVRYLLEVNEALQSQLAEKGRSDWASEDTQALLDPQLYEIDTSVAWQRVRGIGRLPERAQRAAAGLAIWRETKAQSRNLPRGWVMADKDLLAVAEQSIDTTAESLDTLLSSNRGWKRDAEAIKRVLADDQPIEGVPRPRGQAPDAEQKRAVKALALRIHQLAAELEIEPEIIAPMREIRAAVQGQSGLRLYQGWRGRLIGNEIANEFAAA